MSEQDVPTSEGAFHKWMTRLFVVVVIGGGLAFTVKLYEFFDDLTRADGLRFAGSHLLTYCLVAAGFFLLLLACFIGGHFSNIEQAKYDMLEEEERYDRQEFGTEPGLGR